MKFTNTDCVGEDIYWYFLSHAYDQVNEQVENEVSVQINWKVDDQVTWKVYDQIKPIKTKIKQELNK